MDSESVPVVPRRNDPPAGVSVHSESRAHAISGKDPNYDYQWFEGRDERNPGYLENYLQPREVSDGNGHFVTLAPWEVVEEGKVEQGRKRADDGKGTSRQVRHATGYLGRTPKVLPPGSPYSPAVAGAEYIDRLKADNVAASLGSGERTHGNGVSVGGRTVIGDDSILGANTKEILGGV